MFKGPRTANLALLVFSVIVTLLFSEWMFRQILFGESSLFPSIKNPSDYVKPVYFNGHPVYGENYWKLNYLFNRRFNVRNPHPVLGWTGFFDRHTLRHNEEDKIGKKRPVLLYGDSFAMCADESTCFEDILNRDTTFSSEYYFLNFGVGGYGVDQIYLLFNETVNEYEDPFVIFSLLTTDLDRCMLSVRDAQKPYFEKSGDSIELKGTPISLSSSEYFEANPPNITSYLLNKLLYGVNEPKTHETEESRELMEEIKNINTLILEEAFEKLKQRSGDFIVLLFQPQHHGRGDWRLPFIRELLEKNEIPYICDLDLRENDSRDKEFDPGTYALPNDGHPTSYANELVAAELKRCILDSSYRAEAAQYSLGWRDREPVRGVPYYRQLILDSPKWVELVRLKADDKGISLDSMITLDAIYMLNHSCPKRFSI